MFKFLKSKKGFTLVELMIVVVIMAILVAVAVPIYNAVTENARRKTCTGNQRNIISQINTNVMSDAINIADETKLITITSTADDKCEITDAGVFDTTGTIFKGLFNEKNMPFCPESGNYITVKVTAVAGGGCKIETKCYDSANAATDHVIGG